MTVSLPLPAPRSSSRPDATGQTTLRYVVLPGDHGWLECRFLFPGDAVPRRVSLETRKRFEVFLRQPFLLPEDRRLLMRLYMAATRRGDSVFLTGSDGFRVLGELSESGRTVVPEAAPTGEIHPLQGIDTPPLPATCGWRLDHRARLEPVIRTEAGETVVATWPLLAFDAAAHRIVPVEGPSSFPAALAWLRQGPMEEADAADWHRAFALRFPDESFPAPPAIETRVIDTSPPAPVLEFRREPGDADPVAHLFFDYRGQWIASDHASGHLRFVTRDGVVEAARHPDAEHEAATALASLGLGHSAGSTWEPPAGPDAWHRILLAHQDDLRERGWLLRFDGDRDLRAVPADEPRVRFRPADAADAADAFDLEIVIPARDEAPELNLLPWLHQLCRQWSGQPDAGVRAALESRLWFLPLARGETGLFSGQCFATWLEAVFELRDPDPFQGGERIRVSALRAAEISEALGLEDSLEATIPEAVRRIAEVLRHGLRVEPVEVPEGLRATLRDYQRHGVSWLHALSRSGLNGILADDMGLGKTLQTITHLLREKEAGHLAGPALLVAPTSLLANWRDEVARFAPGLTLLTLHGDERRTQRRAIQSADLVLTTYGLVQRDAAWHEEQRYSWIILDEAQGIKNPLSRIARVLGRLHSDRRLCLTGTPMENHLGELWSLFDFLMPGYLGDRETFRRRFRKPIEQEGSEAMRAILARRVEPFLLRRRKNEVARELPPKTVLPFPVEMTKRQRDVYENVREAMQIKVRNEIAEKGLTRSKFVILEALTRLRQVCCDPRLARTSATGLRPADSAKLAALMDLVPDLVREDHRVLVFSQFTSMLALIEEELRAARIRFVTLTGSTTDRERPVNLFQGGHVPVFLISLRAGGTGLNLTAADTVIHYDPWWNPQIENQATDRAYRIGQERPVFVHKMITLESVEEKIVAMQEKKARLAEGILGGAAGEEELEFSEADVEEWFG